MSIETAHGAGDYEYAIFDFSPLQQRGSYVYGINQLGEGAGYADFRGSWHRAARFTVGERPLELAKGWEGHSYGFAINNLGDVVGHYRQVNPTQLRLIMWTDEEAIDLGSFGGRYGHYAQGVNDHRQVVGWSEYPEFNKVRAFLWEDGELKDIGSLGGNSYASDINNDGIIVGGSRDGAPDALLRGVVWDQDLDMTVLPTLHPDTGATAYAISENNDIIAGVATGPMGINHAVVWYDGKIRNIEKDEFPETINTSRAEDVNSDGLVVGSAIRHWRTSDGFVWSHQDGIRILDELVPPNSGYHVTSAFGINDSHQIAANGRAEDDHYTHTLFLQYVDPELGLSPPLPGGSGEMNTWEVTGATPGAEIVVYYSQKGGGRLIGGCDMREAVLQMKKNEIVGSAFADANGVARIKRFVPKGASSLGSILFQAVEVENCRDSRLTVAEFK
jgi:probable HAF family extracellular repeat protein